MKTITYGDTLEIFEYEKKPTLRRKGVKRFKDTKKTAVVNTTKRKDNALQAQRNFRRLVSANLSREKPLLFSITYKENMTDINIGYRDYRLFTQSLRHKFGKDFKYIATVEFQKRGAIHFHGLFWGLPPKIISPVLEKKNRTVANIWGKGFIDIRQTDGNNKLSSYLAKYMVKAFIDPRLKNKKAYVSSRNVLRPDIQSNPLLLPILFKNLEENDVPVFDNKYKTKYLGECRHRLFKIKN